MQIDVVDHVAGAARARGIALVIDVFRAFTVAPHAVAAGASRVLPVGAIEDALALRDAMPNAVLVGERHARRLPGFDAGNSPTEILAIGVAGRPVVHTTHAGTQGLVNATGADEVLTASLVNVSALVRYVQVAQPAATSRSCAWGTRRANAAPRTISAQRRWLRCSTAARRRPRPRPAIGCADAPAAVKFFDPEADWAPLTDFDYCTEVDRFDFVLRLRTGADGRRELERIDVPGATA